MLRSTILAAIGLLAIVSSPLARTWYITPDGTGDAPTIQAAIDSTAVGDTVALSPGIYRESALEMVGGIVVLGDPEAPETVVIDAEAAARVMRAYDFDSPSEIRGLTFRNGDAGDDDGGGIRAAYDTPLTIRDCRFESCRAAYGGGAFLWDGVTVERCEFIECRASEWGGGVNCGASTATFRECTFIRNEADYGGGARISGSSFVDCVFRENIAAGAAGGLAIGVGGSVRGCDFVENRAGTNGGGMTVGELEVEDCRFIGNVATQGGGLFGWYPHAEIRRCEFLGNLAERGGGIYQFSRIDECRLVGNVASEFGGGAYAWSALWNAVIFDSVFANNVAGDGGAVFASVTALGIWESTFVGNRGTNGAGALTLTARDGAGIISRSIIALSPEGPPLELSTSWYPFDIECTDVFGNAAGDWIGPLEPFAGLYGNFSADPLFCDPDAGDFTIRSDSPCAPPGVTGCGLVGALPVGCGPVSVEPESWGRIRAAYRLGGGRE